MCSYPLSVHISPTTTHSPFIWGHLECLALEFINDPSDLPKQKGPGVDEVNPVHHDGNDAVPALKAPGQAVFDEESVAKHEPMLLIPKEDRAFTARADLEQNNNHHKDKDKSQVVKGKGREKLG